MIRARVKRVVRGVYGFRCGYCGVSETQIGSELTYDHFRPQSQNGSDLAANLVYACHACNAFKGEYWSDAEDTRLLHPLTDSIGRHMSAETDGTIKPLTDLGKVHVFHLQLNRPALVANRLEKQRVQHIENHLAQIQVTLDGILSEIKKHQRG